MTDIQTLHRKAMALADEAFEAKREGEVERARSLFRRAFEEERAALNALLAADQPREPTRSVLCRSAATLALDCGDLVEAERIIDLGLSEGHPSSAVRRELLDLRGELHPPRVTAGKSAPLPGQETRGSQADVLLCGLEPALAEQIEAILDELVCVRCDYPGDAAGCERLLCEVRPEVILASLHSTRFRTLLAEASCPVVAVSAARDVKEWLAALDAGCADCIAPPIDRSVWWLLRSLIPDGFERRRFFRKPA